MFFLKSTKLFQFFFTSNDKMFQAFTMINFQFGRFKLQYIKKFRLFKKFGFIVDPRVNGWAMMSSPLPTMAICLSYAYFSKVLGPRLMENRKPFDLRRILIFYNLVQTLFSTWIFYEVSHINID